MQEHTEGCPELEINHGLALHLPVDMSHRYHAHHFPSLAGGYLSARGIEYCIVPQVDVGDCEELGAGCFIVLIDCSVSHSQGHILAQRG